MTIERTYFEIPSRPGPVVASLIAPSASSNYPLVLLATGDSPKGSDGQTWTQFTPRLLERGVGVLRFDFTGLGHSPGVYRDLTLTIGCQNFDGVMSWTQENGNHDPRRIGVIGSSFGGNVALLRAAQYDSIRAIGLKSASTFLPEGYEVQYGAELMRKWGEDGYSDEVGLNYTAVLDSLFHNTYEAASRIRCPVRIVNGTADTAVPIRHARDLSRVMPSATLFELEGVDHWYAEEDAWEVMANDILEFLSNHL